MLVVVDEHWIEFKQQVLVDLILVDVAAERYNITLRRNVASYFVLNVGVNCAASVGSPEVSLHGTPRIEVNVGLAQILALNDDLASAPTALYHVR
jgi:hypothetical protein